MFDIAYYLKSSCSKVRQKSEKKLKKKEQSGKMPLAALIIAFKRKKK